MCYDLCMGRAQGQAKDLFTSVVGERRGLKGDQTGSAPVDNELPGDPRLENLPPPYVITKVPGREDDYDLGEGQIVCRVHPHVPNCDKYGCTIHAPTKHPMDDLLAHLREDSGLIERICPHGVGHPDPDSANYFERERGQTMIGVHGCDGCCSEEARVERDRLRVLQADEQDSKS
jgi:hypothetical protein